MAFGIRLGIAHMIGLSQVQIVSGGAPVVSDFRIGAGGNSRVSADGNVRIIAGV